LENVPCWWRGLEKCKKYGILIVQEKEKPANKEAR